jgi:hypothetical protein
MRKACKQAIFAAPDNGCYVKLWVGSPVTHERSRCRWSEGWVSRRPGLVGPQRGGGERIRLVGSRTRRVFRRDVERSEVRSDSGAVPQR